MPICGGGDPTKAADMVHIPIHTFHGDADTIVPVSGTRAMVAALEAAGSTLVTYTETKGLGHAGWDDVLRDLNNLQWLFAQQKSQ
jgi:predicted peptidase